MPTETEVFNYLNGLKESDVTNTFDITIYLKDFFNINEEEAILWQSKWLNRN